MVKRVGLRIGDQFKADSRKVKFLIKNDPITLQSQFGGSYTDFDVVHHYLRVRRNSQQN